MVKLYRSYRQAIDEEFRLIESGPIELALGMDEQNVDPAFDELSDHINQSSDEIGDLIVVVARTAETGIALSLLLAYDAYASQGR